MGSEEELGCAHDDGKYKPLDGHDEEDQQEQRICWGKIRIPRDPMEVTSILSLSSLALGILLIGVGFGIPREYKFDSDEDAMIMEKTERYYAKLTKKLDICIVVGLGFVGLSALMMSSIVMYLMCHDPKRLPRSDTVSSIGASAGMQQETSLLSGALPSQGNKQYGTHTQSTPPTNLP